MLKLLKSISANLLEVGNTWCDSKLITCIPCLAKVLSETPGIALL